MYANKKKFQKKYSVRALMLASAVLAASIGAAQIANAEKGAGDEAARPAFTLPLPVFGDDKIVRTSLASGLQSGMIGSRSFKDPDAMQAFYAARNGAPLWTDRNDADDMIPALANVLEQGWTHGLNPDHYHLKQIRELAASADPAARGQLDLLISDAVVRYGRDVTGMRIPAGMIGQQEEYWRKSKEAADILAIVSDASDPSRALESLAPQGSLYDRLRQELIALSRSPEREHDEIGKISFGGRLLRPGESHKDVPKLRARLGVAYDPAQGAETRYDDALGAAVIAFQTAQGLNADGVVGAKTLAPLNLSVKDKMDQIVANLERLRWLEQDKPSRYILVNIPSQTLWAVDDNEVVAQMPVVVGRPERPTMSFKTEITGIRLNPKWNVPTTIKAKDYLPKLKEDPYYLAAKGIDIYRVVDGRREAVDPTSVDWANMTRSELAGLNMQQGSGDNNALGRIRVLMPNRYDIYLHDTNAPSLFSKTSRAESSGCVRMADPEAIAKFVLAHNDGWTEDKMYGLLSRGKTVDIKSDATIPVYLLYQTVWLDDQGGLVYGDDLYKNDRRLIKAMTDLKAYQIPGKDGLKFANAGSGSVIR